MAPRSASGYTRQRDLERLMAQANAMRRLWLAEIVSALTIPCIPAEARRGGIHRRSKGAARVDANFLTNF